MSIKIEKINAENQVITATQAAITHFKRHLSKKEVKGIRLNIVKSGCSGYRYEITFVDDKKLITEEDKMFFLEDSEKDPAALFVCVAKKIFPSVMGTIIDYKKTGLNGELVFENPQQTGACGCGESFTIE